MEGIVGALDVAHLSALSPEGGLALTGNRRARRCTMGIRSQDRTGGQVMVVYCRKKSPSPRLVQMNNGRTLTGWHDTENPDYPKRLANPFRKPLAWRFRRN